MRLSAFCIIVASWIALPAVSDEYLCTTSVPTGAASQICLQQSSSGDILLKYGANVLANEKLDLVDNVRRRWGWNVAQVSENGFVLLFVEGPFLFNIHAYFVEVHEDRAILRG